MILFNMTCLKHTLLIFCAMFLFASCAPKPTMEVPEEFKKGQNYFHRVCADCHGADALGKNTKAPNLIDEDYLTANFSDDDIRSTIIDGADKMPPQGRKVTGEEITEIIKYLRHSQKVAGLYIEPDDEDDEDDEDEA